MELIRGTTPTIVINVIDEIDLSRVIEIWVYFYQSGTVKINKKLEDVSFNVQDRQIILTLSQEDTLSLKAGESLFQIRMLLQDGNALATRESSVKINEIYKGGVITEDNE